jgi:hypothetical protein
MAVANATGNTPTFVCPLEAPNYYQRSNGMAVANALGTPTCVPTASFELLSEKQRHGRWKCDGKHTNVCAQFKLRIIIREVTAWPLQMRWEHQRVCPLQASNYYQRSNGTAIANATGNTPTCVPIASFELLLEKQRHGRWKCDGTCPL